MRNWVENSLQKPETLQRVFYFFDGLGVYRGQYLEDGEHGSVYGGDMGVLGGGEVTHWMPDDGGALPQAPYCTAESLGMKIEGNGADVVEDTFNEYFKQFCGPNCPTCGSQLGGILGSFQWGLVHGSGFCQCGRPCQVFHEVEIPSYGKATFTVILAYREINETSKSVQLATPEVGYEDVTSDEEIDQ